MNNLLAPTSIAACKFCESNLSKYVCPRCNGPYCSVECYKSYNHSDCSEAFYKECIEEEMRIREPDADARKSMMEILMRNLEESNKQSEEEDSDDDSYLADRLQGVNLDDSEQVWSKLTPEERKEFLELANSGDISKVIPIWEPWWMKTESKLIKVLNDDRNNRNPDDYKLLCPVIKCDIAVMSSLVKSTPSPLVFNNVLNVTAAYVMTIRFFNGECLTSALEASSLLLSLSKNLSDNVTFDNLDLAIESVSNESFNSKIIVASKENVNVMKNDVAKMVLGPCVDDRAYYILAVFSDIHSLLSCAIKTYKLNLQTTTKTSLPAVFEKRLPIDFTKKQFKMAQKKIDYYLSWIYSFYSDVICQIKPIAF